MGLTIDLAEALADVTAGVLRHSLTEHEAARRVAEIRAQLAPQYCYGPDVLQEKLGALLNAGGQRAADASAPWLNRFLYS
jgi:hypothetical protein